jgi:Zinc dependent phospholipase C
VSRSAAAVIIVVGLVLAPSRVAAYSVLAHESNIDALWDSHIRSLLAHRFPHATNADLLEARAYAYGGSVIQDLGYYPFGSHFFSNLLHYVRSGDFVETLLADARNVNEYAFALGALAHYAADNTGHPGAVNLALALMFPKLRAKYGDSIPYVRAPAHHVMVEFSFDVVQAASGRYAPTAYHDFVGFQVSTEVLQRAFAETYALPMEDVFTFDEDLAIGTYRHAVSEVIPEITRVAWRDKQDEIMRLMPGIDQQRFMYVLTTEEYERQYGADYRKPGFFAKLLTFLYKLLPKIGPLKPLSFKAPTPQAEQLFRASLDRTRERYRAELIALRAGRLSLSNTDFDTGKPSAHGEYELADETYADLLKRLADRKFVNVPDALARNVLAYYDAAPDRVSGRKEAKRMKHITDRLAALRCASSAAVATCP